MLKTVLDAIFYRELFELTFHNKQLDYQTHIFLQQIDEIL